jgi:hypothetical protein
MDKSVSKKDNQDKIGESIKSDCQKGLKEVPWIGLPGDSVVSRKANAQKGIAIRRTTVLQK